jgi:hypothetical protein
MISDLFVFSVAGVSHCVLQNHYNLVARVISYYSVSPYLYVEHVSTAYCSEQTL